MTFKEFDALMKRKLTAEENLDTRTALIVAHIVNWSGYAKKPFKLSDFMPRRKRKKQTPEEMQKMLMALNAALGGDVIDG